MPYILSPYKINSGPHNDYPEVLQKEKFSDNVNTKAWKETYACFHNIL